MTQSFIVTAGRYSCRCEVRLTADGEADVYRMSEFRYHGFRPALVLKEEGVPADAILALGDAAIAAFWELGDPHDDTAIDRAEYRQWARR